MKNFSTLSNEELSGRAFFLSRHIRAERKLRECNSLTTRGVEESIRFTNHTKRSMIDVARELERRLTHV